MRVMHLIKTAVGARWALSQIEVLLEQGIEVHVVLGEDGPMRSQYEGIGAVVHVLAIDIARIRPWKLGGALGRFKKLVNSVDPDLLHSHFVGSTLFMRLALRGRSDLPRVFQVPGPLHLESFLPRWLELATRQSSDYWIATCRYTEKLYRSLGIPETRLFLSYYGTRPGRLTRPGFRERTRMELGLSSEQKAIGLVGYMYPPKRWLGQKSGLKGHEDLIDAIKLLRQEGRNVVGIFVGGAWGNAVWYENQVRSYGQERLGMHALFLGTRNDIPALYEAIDVAVHPSHSENVGGAVESLLLAVPTVTTDVGGFPDVVVDGVTGFLAPHKNPRALALAISKILDDPLRSADMAKEGQALCAQLFDVERTGREISEIYFRVLQRHDSLLTGLV